MYKKTVIKLNKQRYKYNDHNVFTGVQSFEGKVYICKTCHTKVFKGLIPCQAVCNKLCVYEVPQQLSQILIAKRIAFEKIVIMSKGQQRKIKGAICNVPVECNETCNVVPRPPKDQV